MQKMLKHDLTNRIMNETNHYLKEKKNVIGLMKVELGGKIKKEFIKSKNI